MDGAEGPLRRPQPHLSVTAGTLSTARRGVFGRRGRRRGREYGGFLSGTNAGWPNLLSAAIDRFTSWPSADRVLARRGGCVDGEMSIEAVAA